MSGGHVSDIVPSRFGVPIRLTPEAWDHILKGHPELIESRAQILSSLETPDYIVDGGEGELLAVRKHDFGKWLVVVYKEANSDGFIITAYITSRETSLKRKKQIWP